MGLGMLAGPMRTQATPIDVQMEGASVALNNSSLNLLLENVSIESSLLPDDFNQAAQLNIQINAATTVNFDITQNVTIEGVTQALTMSGVYLVTNAKDTLTLFGGSTALFNTGSGTFRLTALGGEVSGTYVGQFGFDVGDHLEQVPEPGTLALLSLGLAGIGLTKRRKKV
jgi:hypothetical protein